MFPDKGMSGSDLRRSHHSETVGILKQLTDESRVDLQTLEMLESELFKAEDAQFVKLKGLITRLIIRLEAEVGHISDCNEETLMIDEKKENPEVDVTSSSTMFTSPEVIDEAGFVSTRLTLDESKNTEADRAKLQDTLEGMHDPKGINIHEDTLEEPKTDTTKGPNSVDSKELNCPDCKTRSTSISKALILRKTLQMVCTSTRVTSMNLLCKFRKRRLWRKQSRSHKCRLLRKSLERNFESSTICLYAAG